MANLKLKVGDIVTYRWTNSSTRLINKEYQESVGAVTHICSSGKHMTVSDNNRTTTDYRGVEHKEHNVEYDAIINKLTK